MADAPTGSVKEDYDDTMLMERTVYTDGSEPFIGPIIKLIRKPEILKIFNEDQIKPSTEFGDNLIEHIPQQTFVMTFSEAIKYDGTLNGNETDFDKLANVISTKLGVTIKDMEWEVVENTWSERKLVFTVNQLPSSTGDGKFIFDSTTFKEFEDLAEKKFNVDTQAMYVARKPDLNSISYAQLWGEVNGPFPEANDPSKELFDSESVMLGMELNVRNDIKHTYYYVTQNSTATSLITVEDIVNVAEDKTYGGFTGIGNVGEGDLLSEVENTGTIPSDRLEIKTSIGAFRTDQKIYLVTVDDYGNIVGIQGTNLYVPISYTSKSTSTP